MRSASQEKSIFRIERAGVALRWTALVIVLATIVLGGVPWEWFDVIVGVSVIVAHNIFAHIALAKRRADWFATRTNFGVNLAEVSILLFVTGADESIAFVFYPILLFGLTAYTRRGRVLAASTALCVLSFGAVLLVEYMTGSLIRPWGEMAGKAFIIAGAGWAVSVLSNQQQRNADAARRDAEALATSEATLRTILNTAADLILVVDENDRITEANDRACAFLRLDREEILGQRPRAFLFDDGTLGVRFASLRAHGEYRGEMIVIDADGGEHTVDMLIRAFLRNGVRHHVVIAQDITEKKAFEEATRMANRNLAQLNRELRQVDQMKRDFFNTVSVRMRSPVAAILGYADMLLANELGELSPEQLRAVQTCRRSAQRLLEMVDEAIDIGSRQPTGLTAPEEPTPADDEA